MLGWNRTASGRRRDSGRGALDALDREIEVAMMRLLAARGPGGLLALSESALAVGGDGWRGLLGRVRRVAVRLASAGLVEFVWQGKVVDPSDSTVPALNPADGSGGSYAGGPQPAELGSGGIRAPRR